MKEVFMSLPIWFRMIIIAGIVAGILYVIIRRRIQVKVGSAEVELLSDAESKEEK